MVWLRLWGRGGDAEVVQRGEGSRMMIRSGKGPEGGVYR